MKLTEVKEVLLKKEFVTPEGKKVKIIGITDVSPDFVLGTENNGVIRVAKTDIQFFIDRLKPFDRVLQNGVEFAATSFPARQIKEFTPGNFLSKNERFESIADKLMQIVDGDFTDAEVKRAEVLCKVSSSLVSMEQTMIKSNQLLNNI